MFLIKKKTFYTGQQQVQAEDEEDFDLQSVCHE